MTHPDRVNENDGIDADDRQDLDGRDRIARLELRQQRVAKQQVFASCFILIAVIVGVASNRSTISDIQRERQRNIAKNCVEQNDRHERTISQLDAGLKAAIQRRPKQAARVRESRDFTVSLIDQLAPYRPDCIGYAEKQVHAG